MSLNVDKARKELKEKTYLEIQEATAWTWASRACAAFKTAADVDGIESMFGWFIVADEYRHEAIEHAALIEDSGQTLKHVEEACDHYRSMATMSLQNAVRKKT